MYGPSIEKVFFEMPLKFSFKFSILIRQLFDFTEETSQLYSPSFSVIAIRFHLIPLSDDK
tara:strand:+ start:3753 stop:3932 length:180 start_codon:yes stop_codon:yes gene_type:complete